MLWGPDSGALDELVKCLGDEFSGCKHSGRNVKSLIISKRAGLAIIVRQENPNAYQKTIKSKACLAKPN